MGDCNCGTTGTGSYLGKIGGQLGDRFEGFGRGMIENAKKKFKAFTGLGEYQLVGNSLVRGANGGGVLTAVKHGNVTTISYKEYLGDIVTGPVIGGFNINSIQINPGNEASFPWLCSIANQFDQYKPKGIVYEFKSTASDTTTLASIGSVIMATEYDVYDRAYTSKAEMLQSAYSNEAKMSDDMVHGIECDPTELQRNLFYVTQYGVITEGDKRDQTMGTFYYATQGGSLPVNSSVGSLYVHYEFDFYKEQIFGGVASKGELYSTYTTVAPAGGLAMENTGVGYFFALLSGGISSGRDLGIYSSVGAAANCSIPRWLQGATIRVDLQAYMPGATGWTPSGILPLNITQLFPISGCVMVDGGFTHKYQINGPMVIGGIVNPVTPGTFDTMNWTYVWKMDDVLTADAVFGYTTATSEVWPAPSIWPAGVTTKLRFTVYPVGAFP